MKFVTGVMAVSCLFLTACGKDESSNAKNSGNTAAQASATNAASCETPNFMTNVPAEWQLATFDSLKDGKNSYYVLREVQATNIIESVNSEKATITARTILESNSEGTAVTQKVTCANWQGAMAHEIDIKIPTVISRMDGSVSKERRLILNMDEATASETRTGDFVKMTMRVLPHSELQQTSYASNRISKRRPKGDESAIAYRYYWDSSSRDLILMIQAVSKVSPSKKTEIKAGSVNLVLRYKPALTR